MLTCEKEVTSATSSLGDQNKNQFPLTHRASKLGSSQKGTRFGEERALVWVAQIWAQNPHSPLLTGYLWTTYGYKLFTTPPIDKWSLVPLLESDLPSHCLPSRMWQKFCHLVYRLLREQPRNPQYLFTNKLPPLSPFGPGYIFIYKVQEYLSSSYNCKGSCQQVPNVPGWLPVPHHTSVPTGLSSSCYSVIFVPVQKVNLLRLLCLPSASREGPRPGFPSHLIFPFHPPTKDSLQGQADLKTY